MIGAAPQNKGMKLTSVEHIGRSQLIPGVRRTLRCKRAGPSAYDCCREVSLKRSPIIIACLLWTVCGAAAQRPGGQRPEEGKADQAIRQQDEQRIHAQVAADAIALRRIYADDFLGIGPTGVMRNKEQVIADFTSHDLTYQSITTADVLVRIYGNAAVETGRSTMVGVDKGKVVPHENRFTRVWVVKEGRWQLVSNHYSPMTAP